MKRVLIIGEGSYIGDCFIQYAGNRFHIDVAGTLNNEWRDKDFSGYDAIIQVAGIAHRKQKAHMSKLYYEINCRLPVLVAEKAKKQGIRQFIFLSTMSVYGMRSGEIGGDMTPNPIPADYYGSSKYAAEKELEQIRDANFKIAIIRPPMVYGLHCKGKYQQLIKIAKLAPFFPTIPNKRSMLFIDNLSEFLALVIENEADGIMCPQNSGYVNTSQMLFEVAAAMEKKRFGLPVLNLLVKILMPVIPPLKTAFGSLYYSQEASKMPFDKNYQIVGNKESYYKSVKM